MVQNDPAAIDGIAANVMSEPWAWTDLARQYVDNDTAILPVAFGAIGVPMLAFNYRPARESQLDNVEHATTRVREMAEGLARVAANWRHADHVSTPVGRTGLAAYTPPPTRAGGTARTATEAILLATAFTAVKLLPQYIASAKVAGLCGKFAISAKVGVVFWALTLPIDEPIDQAIGGWMAAANQLGAAKDFLSSSLESIDGAWEEGSDRDAFESWKARFLPEFDDAKQAAEKTAEALAEAKKTIIGYQLGFFVFSMTMLVTIITLYLAERLPYVGPAAKVMKELAGALFVIGTVGAVGGMANSISTTMSAIPVAQSTTFGSLSVNVAGGGIGFKDVGVGWDDHLNSIRIDTP